MTCRYRSQIVSNLCSKSHRVQHQPILLSGFSFRIMNFCYRSSLDQQSDISYFSCPLYCIFHFLIGSKGSNFKPSAPNSSSVPKIVESGNFGLVNSPSPGTFSISTRICCLQNKKLIIFHNKELL